jgi:probable HAF family extracellular repeat protein
MTDLVAALGLSPSDALLAKGVNDSGQVVLSASPPGSSFGFGLLYTPGVGATYFNGLPMAVNDAGQVVGDAAFSNQTHAFLYSGGPNTSGNFVVVTDLGTLGGGYSGATAINAAGQVVGGSNASSTSGQIAFLWTPVKGMCNLGISAAASGINSSGQVVAGNFLWYGGVATDLNSLLPANSGWQIGNTTAINDSGQIVGIGTINSQTHAFLLTLDSTPTISWSAPSAVTYPAALSAAQLDATAIVPGTFVYTPPAGTVLRAGNGQTLSVTFTPTDMTDFSTVTATTTINVNQGTPFITWPAPAPITFGGALGSGQLDASANVAGSFAYNPPAGTVLPVGNGQTLSAVFTPNDMVDYGGAVASTSINVKPASVSGSPANLVVTSVLAYVNTTPPCVTPICPITESGYVAVQLTISNTGGTAAKNVVVNTIKVGGANVVSPLPQNVGVIAPGASAQVTGVSLLASGLASSLSVSGTYTGGTFNSNTRVTLPTP